MYNKLGKRNCSGCHACFNICPVNCISMDYDSEGFLYPIINQSLCIKCGRCEKACPVLNKSQSAEDKINAYAGINLDENTRMQSSSGGIFSLIAEYVLDNNGVVFGASFDENQEVCHIEISEKSELSKLRGAKYLQSRIGDAYAKTEKILKEDRLVLFSGTPCQIAGIKAYLGKEYQNLILLDIICHGVPSPKIWTEYLKQQENKNKTSFTKIGLIKFREKVPGWRNYSIVLDFGNGRKYKKLALEDSFMRAFLKNYILRPSCYNCHFKIDKSMADITLGDFWGIEKVLPDVSDNKGISLIFAHTEKGRNVLQLINEKMLCYEVKAADAVKYNPSAVQSTLLPPEREKFIDTVFKYGFKEAEKVFLKRTFKERCFNKVKRKIKEVLNYVQK
ncbi:MAG: Coenzyme F420 hydrogenase/dehydrogenase, beta subunit C-terminal domain [Clostridia bacterium]|nr:Coenzyme F420 hydrogenase/dehydrogenase, beta subunit C-terminal domain [Clostridia bacterium]